MHPFYIEFLLTRLLRGATTDGQGANNYIGVSTHTPLARRDKDSFLSSGISIPFLLTRLLRGATHGIERLLANNMVSTHTPLARRDWHEAVRI